MSENIKPFGEDISNSFEDLAEFSGDLAMEIYKKELENNSNLSKAFSAAMEAATNSMMDAGCPKDVCDLIYSAAIEGYDFFLKENPNCDAMDAFDAAGDSVNKVLEREFE